MISSDGRDFYGSGESMPSKVVSPTDKKGIDYWKQRYVKGKVFKKYTGRVVVDAQLQIPVPFLGWSTIKTWTSIPCTEIRQSDDWWVFTVDFGKTYGVNDIWRKKSEVALILDRACTDGSSVDYIEETEDLPVLGKTRFRAIVTTTRFLQP